MKQKDCSDSRRGCSGSCSVTLCSSNEFLKRQMNENLCLEKMPKNVEEVEEKRHEPVEFQLILDGFGRIVSNYIPMGVRPIRSISLHVDLILGLILPN